MNDIKYMCIFSFQNFYLLLYIYKGYFKFGTFKEPKTTKTVKRQNLPVKMSNHQWKGFPVFSR